jgi:WD40 repeat protein
MNGNQHVEALLPRYIIGKLSSEERTRVEEHLPVCSTCSRALTEWQAVASAVRQSTLARSPSVVLPPLRVPPAGAIVPTSNGWKSRWVFSKKTLLVAASLLVIATTVALFALYASRTGVVLAPFPDLDRVLPITQDTAARLMPLTTLGKGEVLDVDWSPDGEQIAVSASGGLYMHALEANTEPILVGGQNGYTSAAAFSPDGEYIAGIRNNTVAIWRTRTGELVQRITTGDTAVGELVYVDADTIAITACPEDTLHWSLCEKPVLRLWNTIRNEQSAEFTLEVNAQGVQFSPDGTVFAYRTMTDRNVTEDKRQIIIVDAVTGVTLTRVQITPSPLFFPPPAYAFSHDSTRFAYAGGGSGADIKIYTIQNLRDTYAARERFGFGELHGSASDIQYLAFAADNSEVFAISEHGVTTHNAENGIATRTARNSFGYTRQWAFSPRAGSIALVNKYGQLATLSPEDEELTSLYPYGETYSDIRISHDNHLVAGITRSSINSTPDRLWNLQEFPFSETVIASDVLETTTTHTAVDLSFASDGSYAFSYGIRDTGRVILRNLNAEREDIALDDVFAYNVFYTADGNLYTLSEVGTLSVWEGSTLLRKVTIQGLQPELSNTVTFSFDGRYVGGAMCLDRRFDRDAIYTCTDPQVWVWSTQTGEKVLSLDGDTGESVRLAFSQDGGILAISDCSEIDFAYLPINRTFRRCTSASIRLFNLSRLGQVDVDRLMQPILTFRDFAYPPSALAFSPIRTGDTLLLAVSGGSSDLASVWRVNIADRTHERLYTIENPNPTPMSYGATIAFSPDGRLLAVSYVAIIQLWGVYP